MKKLYKVVRSDMTSCHDPEFKYVLGQPATDPNYDGKSSCGNGLHACYTPEATLQYRNGVWPVRLFEAIAGTDCVEVDADKCKSRELTLVEELPVGIAFGPAGARVAEKLDQISRIQWLKPKTENRAKVAALVQEHLKRLSKFGGPDSAAVVFAKDAAAARDAAWAAAWAAAWDAAWAAARDAAWAAAWDAEYSLVSDLVDWPSPWEPLIEIYELGYWPVCLKKDGKFLVYEPEIKE